jgi:hypothetical protein
MKAFLENNTVIEGRSKAEIVKKMCIIAGVDNAKEYMKQVKKRNKIWNLQEMKFKTADEFFDSCVNQKIILMYLI